MNDVMIDIETLGLSADATILSIAAVEFDRYTGDIGSYAFDMVDLCGQDRRVCTKTLKWWAQQSPGMFAKAINGERHIVSVLASLAEFIPDKCLVWSQGIDFDFGILEHAYESYLAGGAPWQYNAKRDTRTLYDVAGFDPKSIERTGEHHNALDDCLHQIKCVVAALNNLKVVKP
jgi:DNA polymerase III alpha subunit (gram-positive type)